VERLKRRRQREDREQYKWVVLTRPGTLYPPPTPHALRVEHTRTIAPARALAAESLNLERLPNAECGVQIAECCDDLTPAEIELMWKTAPPRMPVPPLRFPGRESHGRFAGNAPRNIEIQ
jgi:hypothetical protein